METLKFKIFDVLTEKITVSEFENWLYNNEEIVNRINSNDFYFDLISVDYKKETWQKQLKNLIKNKYSESFLEILKIEIASLDIYASSTLEEICNILANVIEDFDYDTDYDIMWKFYSLYEDFNSFQGSMFNKIELENEAKFYAKQVINLTKRCNTYKETEKALIQDLNVFNPQKTIVKYNLKQKFLAFFKKI